MSDRKVHTQVPSTVLKDQWTLLSHADFDTSVIEPSDQTKLRTRPRLEKSSSFNGVAFQRLQMQRIESLIEVERQNLLRKQRKRFLTHYAEDFFNVGHTFSNSTTASDKSRDLRFRTNSLLPCINSSTKRELIRLNAKYSATMEDDIIPTCIVTPNNCDDGTELGFEKRIRAHVDYLPPVKLLFPDDDTINSASVVTTICEMQGNDEVNSNGDHYLLHLEHLAREKCQQKSNKKMDDNSSSCYESSPSPYDFPKTQLIDDDFSLSTQSQIMPDKKGESNYFSCMCQVHTLISGGEQLESSCHVEASVDKLHDQNEGGSNSLSHYRPSRSRQWIVNSLIIFALSCFFTAFGSVRCQTRVWHPNFFGMLTSSDNDNNLERFVEMICLKNYTHTGSNRIAKFFRHCSPFFAPELPNALIPPSIIDQAWLYIAKLHSYCRKFLREKPKRELTIVALKSTMTFVSSNPEHYFINSPTLVHSGTRRSNTPRKYVITTTPILSFSSVSFGEDGVINFGVPAALTNKMTPNLFPDIANYSYDTASLAIGRKTNPAMCLKSQLRFVSSPQCAHIPQLSDVFQKYHDWDVQVHHVATPRLKIEQTALKADANEFDDAIIRNDKVGDGIDAFDSLNLMDLASEVMNFFKRRKRRHHVN